MITWTTDGCGVLVDEIRFQREVMSLYPGFVQIPNFNNLRRQLRVYNFEWRLLDDHMDNLVFYHPCFQRGHPEMLPYVFTRRPIIKPTKRKSSCTLNDTYTDDDQPEGILPQHSPSSSALGVYGELSPKKRRRQYKRRKPLRTIDNINQHIPDSKELNSSTSAHDDANSTEARSTDESSEIPCQNSSEPRITKNSSEKLFQKSTEGKCTSLSTERPFQNSLEAKSTCNSSEKPCEEDAVFQGDMRTYTCECMSCSKQGEGDGVGKGEPIYLKNCSFSECCNHICGHCNACWVSKSFSELPSKHVQPHNAVPYFYFQHHPAVNYGTPQERHYSTTPYGYQFMAPMMPPIGPQYVMDANIINASRSSQLTSLQTMRPADLAASHATHTNKKASDTKTISSSQGPGQECWNPPKTYHRLETVPDAMSWQPGNMYNETYHNFATTQKFSRYEKAEAPWCWNYAPASHVYQIPPNLSANNCHGPAQTYFTEKTVGSSNAAGTITSQKPKCIPQAIQVKSTMPMQCCQQVEGERESVPNVTIRNHLERINSCKEPMKQGIEDDSKEICRDEGEDQSSEDKEGATSDVEYRDKQQTEASMVVHKSQIGNSDDRCEDMIHTEPSKDNDNHQDVISQENCEGKHETKSSVIDQIVSYDEKGEDDSSEEGEGLKIVTNEEDCDEVVCSVVREDREYVS